MQINDLPIEVLENIFRFVPFRQLKTASLVCIHWHLIIFSRTCMQNVVLDLMTAKVRNLPIVELETSQRSYRIIRLVFNSLHFDRRLSQYFLKILRKFSDTLQRLDIVWKVYDKPPDLVLLVAVSTSVPQLQQLNVFVQQNTPYEENSNELIEIAPMKFLTMLRLPRCVLDDFGFDLTLFAPNVKHIRADFGKNRSWDAIRALQDQLITMGIKTETKGNFGQFWSLRPAKLQKLRLIRHRCDLFEPNDVEIDSVRNFFLHCPALTVLKLDLKVPMEVLRAIVDSCPQLESLMVCGIDDGWQLLSILQPLEKLQNLSVIAATFYPLLAINQTIRLPALQHLSLCAPDLLDVTHMFEHLNMTAPNLSTLQLFHYSQICDEDLNIRTLESLFRSRMRMLKKLILFDFCCVFPSHLINQLNLFPRLNELWITSRALSPHFESAIVPTLRRLAVDAPINQFLLRSLLEVFPSLSRLDVSEGNDYLDEQSIGHEINFCRKRSLLEDRTEF